VENVEQSNKKDKAKQRTKVPTNAKQHHQQWLW